MVERMSETVIQVEGLGKRYRIGQGKQHNALSHLIGDALRAPFRLLGRGSNHNFSPQAKGGSNGAANVSASTNNGGSPFIWALRDVSFEVRKGEVVGLIGRNGAGKSTLLKVLSRITRPTEGHAELRGRIGSLLEVGTGFHPELTGRENVFMSGAVLGMRAAEIRRKFDEIVAFSEVERFLDTPLKYYSSGMQMRLAFAVAAHLDPEILFVDEVLAVGDISFQKKCLGKMQEVSETGRTIVFISHHMNQIRRLCGRTLWLDAGKIRESGITANVVGNYEAAARASDATGEIRKESGPAQFLRWEVVGAKEGQPNVLDWDGQVRLKFVARVSEPLKNIHHGIALYNSAREVVWGNAIEDLSFEPGVHELMCTLPSLPLRPGVYTWRVSFYHRGERVDDWDCSPAMFVSTQPCTHKQDEFAGLLNIPSEFTSERKANGTPI
jgi:lipopolysaccharide transport system ATP-binding protein